MSDDLCVLWEKGRGGEENHLVCSFLILDYHHQVQEKNDSALRGQPLETQLEPRIAKFISLICNISMMKQHMMEIGWLISDSLSKRHYFATNTHDNLSYSVA